MITIEEIKTRKQRILDLDKSELTKREKSMYRKDLECYRNCILYLEQSPSEDFIKKQLQETKKRLSDIKDKYTVWATQNGIAGETDARRKSRFASIFNTKNMAIQIKHLNFILKV